ncbi:hypothetical protein [Anaeromicropila herbilytica]|uniref:Uncharacterized protein n=1 Tax=Anaeromicropila herbilytica TaxID=2785025 RepID=A0A7R7EMJ2_9FIRM|nr:hypothetical protein [Anaeromicropila herbilytica]BCN31499.1 hypothetical protein bsdtb5_27940 [Anaeromicropila herbilytica]
MKYDTKMMCKSANELHNHFIMKDTLGLAADKYDSCEESILDYYGLIENNIQANKDGRVVTFGVEGEYGGNQGGPAKRAKDDDTLIDIVKKYFPNMSKDEIEDYLEKLNSEGCGYVAMVNTLFKNYEGREEEFEKKFGFPMCTVDKGGEKHLNFEYLITDYYAATDNHNQKSFLFFYWDHMDNDEDQSNTKGDGTTMDSREYRWEMYMKDHGIDVDVQSDVQITLENYSEYSKKVDIIIAIRPITLENELGDIVRNDAGGHAMTVTGITDDLRFIVSSWGRKYYVNPEYFKNLEDGYNNFQVVKYK